MCSRLNPCERLHSTLSERVLSKKIFGRTGLIPDMRAFTASSADTTLNEQQYSYATLLASVTELEYRTFVKDLIATMDPLPVIKRSGPVNLHRPSGSLIGGHVADLVSAIHASTQQVASETTLHSVDSVQKVSGIPSRSEHHKNVDEPSLKLVSASSLLPPMHFLNACPSSSSTELLGGVDEAPSSVRKTKDSDKRGKPQSASSNLAKQLIDEGILVDLNIDIYNSQKLIGMKSALVELETSILVPVNHPHLYTKGLSLNRGILLYGPPGSGKTFLCKCVAAAAGVSFFIVTASHIMSKWQGESEKLVSSLFQLAREKAPSIILIDEIDGLLSQRSGDDSDGIRRVKNQFLQCFDETKHYNNEQILQFSSDSGASQELMGPSSPARSTSVERLKFVIVLGATNFPEAIDQAAFRRFDKRIFISLPDTNDREQFLLRNLPKHLIEEEPDLPRHIADRTHNFSNADLELLCEGVKNCATRKLVEAEYFIKNAKNEWVICEHGDTILETDTPENKALRPLLFKGKLSQLPKGRCNLPKITLKDALDVLRNTFPSVTEADMKKYHDFAQQFKHS
ncbi:Vacuolar protein sorting 4c [Giardia duodenalis]|uniref:Vacuolar protein sorting 4c n=1 Tax=Giardia intestinalis (strain ATCC 50803 / WB clone C6) TaxID=184922 RepID=A8B7M3_GIAIC|nr:Vacuolar protein sorting 4c [Giardia intestinalis]KAE8305429.1 Vacuolar protein sorting 4c [Giardia intestinalis]|eukprot:XP_001708839.1 SKD1 protein [Giardia lamblia ATCC 50803]